MKAKILKGERNEHVGLVLTIVDSEGDDVVAVRFEDGKVETFDSKDVEITK